MKRSLFSGVEDFSLSPLLAILPVRGDVRKLEALSSSIFARYERVSKLQSDASGEGTAATRRRHDLEAAMLKQVLEWLSITAGNERDGR